MKFRFRTEAIVVVVVVVNPLEREKLKVRIPSPLSCFFSQRWHVSPFAVHLKLPRHSKLAIPQHKTKSLKSGRKKKRELIRNAHQVTETVLRAMEKPRQKVMTPAL